jgi:hypothetical protein
MKLKKIEDFTHDVEVAKEVLSSMPINNQKNLKSYKAKVTKMKEDYIDVRNEIYEEIKKRSSKYFQIQEDGRVKVLSSELEGYKNLKIFNPLNSPYEKLGLDNILYRLNHFFKNDLADINNDILTVINLFREVGIEINSSSFVYSNYAKTYIKELLTDSSIERMKFVFEELHWKCPDVILHVSMNIRLLYNKNKSKFVDYINNKQKEIFSSGLSYQDCVIKRDNIIKELYEITHYDMYSILNGFLNSELILNDYTIVNVDKCKSKYYREGITSDQEKELIGDVKNLLDNVIEFKNYLKYVFVLDDVKKKYAERINHLGEDVKIAKEIDVIANELVKINETIDTGYTKGILFFKKRVDTEKLYLDLNAKIKELSTKYDEYDIANVYEQMNKHLNDTSTIYDVFNFALSYKTYLRSCIKSSKDEADIEVVKQTVSEFDQFLNNSIINVIRNTNFLVDNDIAEIISDHYQLLNLRITKEVLDADNLANLIADLTIIVNNFYMNELGLDINLVNDLFDSKKILENES